MIPWDVIPWDGESLHGPVRTEGCWGDRDGVECGDPPTLHGLCGDCLVRLTGERPMRVQPAPPSMAAVTGSGRR